MAEMLAEDYSTEDEKAEVRRDVFTTEAEAKARAEEIGCVGTHSHDEDGETVYMPCRTHEDYTEATGEDLKFDDSYETDFIEVSSELKAVDNDEDGQEYGRFEGYGSVFNNTDLGNDVIKNGAFRKSLRKRGAKSIKLLYQHKTDMPIGVFDSMKEDEHGLYVKGRLALKTQAGAEAYELLKMGALDGLSIGFRLTPKGYQTDKRTRKRVIDEVDLMEVSLVTFPMNPRATVQSVKGQDISIREWENGLRDAFSISRSEAKAAAKAILTTFTERDAVVEDDVVEAMKKLTTTLKTVRN